jgi:hypothetical protein
MIAEDWAQRLAAAETTGILEHAGRIFLKVDRAPPPGRSGPVFQDSAGFGLWVPSRNGLVLVERR